MSASADATGKREKNWFPLESNPDVMNAYIAKLGFPTELFSFVDVMSVEDWALEMIPRPVLAVMLLFPIKEASEKHREEEHAKILEEGQVLAPSLYFTKQIIGNACGTIGILHSVMNNTDALGGPVPLRPDSFFDKFLKSTLALSPEDRAIALEADDEIEESHEAVAQEGQSAVVADVNTHFIAFIVKDGNLYEMDGRKSFPINHGPSSQETLLQDACAVIGKFMARDPEEVNFALTALVATPEDD